MGSATSIPGQEGVPAVYSPMARTLKDLETFWKAIVSMKPWEYEHTVSSISRLFAVFMKLSSVWNFRGGRSTFRTRPFGLV